MVPVCCSQSWTTTGCRPTTSQGRRPSAWATLAAFCGPRWEGALRQSSPSPCTCAGPEPKVSGGPGAVDSMAGRALCCPHPPAHSEVHAEDAGGPHQQGSAGVCQETEGAGEVHGDGPLNLLQLPAPSLPQVPVVVLSHCGQLCAARACGAPSLLRGVRVVAGCPSSHLPWCVHVVCAVNSLHPASPAPNPGSRWPTRQGLASRCLPGCRVEQAWSPGELAHLLPQDPQP